ncbi:MAG: MIP/aquaporin family protein [Finegoldia magna]|uniref:Aquaporin family protein n=1 Tax=Finegoldia magna TaxID=1260 RepID=A0A2N6SRP8_FINMA|nr:MIP/aquaporin family protein [Finegoldia magna]MDU1580012.1 MIP/aquaporin family protein [Finegoldia magna]MDU1600806.1 MIP/aquaporin family protein [Finegoldia magna]MDU5214442.1 MIP/aquaporin family protein [Finegoldia magna]MDU5237413.1 MIP/aquaporin family protein [Finegoldia magna]PMC59748.1 aquaporin family protein [Finegoldia magna]
MSSEDNCCCCEVVTKESLIHGCVGEIIGTFLMCFLGIGSVCTATLYQAHTGPFQVGVVWGVAIALGIYATRNLSCAHFNPAVTFAMCISKRCSWKNLPVYILGQFIGSILAASALWVFFADSVKKSLDAANLTMEVASPASSIWCEVFPNTANGVISMPVAAFAEALGVFILVMIIFSMTEGCNVGRPSDDLFPLFIGLTVTVLICTIGPMTDAGLNPARDLGPRVVGWFVGWKNIAFSTDTFIVYTIAPLIGAGLAAIFFTRVIEPMQNSRNNCC